MRRAMKLSTALVAAVLVMTLLAGAAFAAAKLNIWDALDTAEPIIPLEGADELVATDLASAETDYFRITIQEGVYDGFGAIVKLHAEPMNPEEYVIITDFAFPSDLGDKYTSEVVQEYEDGFKDERVTGRKDGKEIIYLSTPSLSVSGEIANADSFGVNHMFNSIADQYNDDGSVDFWISGMFSYDLPETLSVTLRVRGMDIDHNTAYGTVENLSFNLIKNNKERTVRLSPAEGEYLEDFELIDAQITFTEVRGYIAVEYASPLEAQDMGLSLHLLDADGNRISTGGGHCTDLKNGRYLWELEMQSFEEIPETMIFEVKMIDGDPIGQIECRVETIAD